jgi:hypothetical protein
MSLEAELESYAEKHQGTTGRKCAVCLVDTELRTAIEDARRRGRPASVIVAFLKTKGVVLAEHQIGNHMRKHAER